MTGEAAWLVPQWPAPVGVRAISTTRTGGYGSGSYASLNLAAHVGDEAATVARNRALLVERAALPETPRWLKQVHGTRVVLASSVRAGSEADAVITDRFDTVCGVLTADCLPVLICAQSGAAVAAVHGGWRGLTGGVIESSVAAFGEFGTAPGTLLAWLGPAISMRAYEVGGDVRDALDTQDLAAIRPNDNGRWQLDLYELARLRLRRAGITAISGGEHCTFGEPDSFFSYRRDGVCGRQATLIWRGNCD